MMKVTIQNVGIDPKSYQPIVLLKEDASERYLPIWIGSLEANAIIIKLQGANLPRPLSHDLLLSVIGALGASIESIIINDLKNDTFYSRILLNTAEGQIAVDSRPSDALALAIRAEVPIFVEDMILDEAGIFIDAETGKVVPQQMSEEANVSEEELKQLSAFTDFVDTLDMDNFGESGQGENEDGIS
jgi:bifunctional DNase/RNase